MIRILLILLLIVYPCKSELQEKICAGEEHSCSISTEGKVRCWGRNYFGQLGYGDTENRGDEPGEMGSNLPYVDNGFGIPVDITCGSHHTCVLLDNGRIKCWGLNDSGRLGYGSVTQSLGDEPGEMGTNLKAVDTGSGRTIRMVSAGRHNTCVVLDTKDVKCWGYGIYGVPGLGLKTSFFLPPFETIDLGFPGQVEQVSVGTNHACARLTNGRVKCWGQNTYGQLGYGDTNHRGDGPGEMGSALPLIDLGSNNQVTYINAGHHHTCARLADETVKCWGLNSKGQLGVQGGNLGDQSGEMGSALASVDFGTTSANVKEIRMGVRWTCVVFVDGRLKCFGDYGESSPPNDNDAYIDFGTDNLVHTLGLHASNHACVVFVNGKVKCFGDNSNGPLGLGDNVDRFNFSDFGNNLPFVDLSSYATQSTNESQESQEVAAIVISIIAGLLVLFFLVRYFFYGNFFGFLNN